MSAFTLYNLAFAMTPLRPALSVLDGGPRLGGAADLYPAVGAGQKPAGFDSPAFRYVAPRRFAARSSTSLAHVTGLASSDSAADTICRFSASVMGISMAAVLRSLGFLGGLPRLVSMPLKIYRKNPLSSLARRIISVYNKYGKKKPPEALARDRGPPQPAFA